jgi:hypothetical protein
MTVNLTTAFEDVSWDEASKTITFKNGLSTNLKQVALTGLSSTYTATDYQAFWLPTQGHRHVNGTNNLMFSVWPAAGGTFTGTVGSDGILFAGACYRTRITGGKGYDYLYTAPILFVDSLKHDSHGFRMNGRNGWTGETSSGQFTVPVTAGQVITFGARFTNGNDGAAHEGVGQLDVGNWTWNDGWEWYWGSANYRLYTA